jgi:sugar lactone lactonase YvrE
MSDNVLYVADERGHCVSLLDVNGSYLRKIGSEGSGDGQLNCPSSVCISGDLLYVSDTLNHRICVFRLDGSFVRAFGSDGKEDAKLQHPTRVYVVKDQLYVVDHRDFTTLCMFDLAGNLVRLFASGKGESADGLLCAPTAVCAVEDLDLLFVADSGKSVISVFGLSDGSFKRNIKAPAHRCFSSICFSCGVLYVTEYCGNMYVFDLNGSLVCEFQYYRVFRFVHYGLMVDDGRLFVAGEDSEHLAFLIECG